MIFLSRDTPNKKERPIMTELTPLALKLRTAYSTRQTGGES